jgi:hypothetical protein
MNYELQSAFATNSTATVAIAIVSILTVVSAILLTSTNSVFAENYEKSQGITQVNDCNDYWFPFNVLCSNINSQIQDDENSVSVTAAQEDGNVKSAENFGAPFP